MAYRVAIVDDSNIDAEYVQSILKEWAKDRQAGVQAQRFVSAESFLFHYVEDKAWDILLLDIEMPGKSGVELAKEIRKTNEAIQIVFVTGYSDYIAEGYEVSALHYLMKPVNEEKFFSVLDRAVSKLKSREKALFLETSSETVHVPMHAIRYIDVRQNYVTVHAREDYTVKKTLGAMEKELDDRFFRAGRSLILNLGYIRRVSKTDVYLEDGTVLQLPRGVYDALNRAIIERL